MESPGYLFRPSEYCLLFHYLYPKLRGDQLPFNPISEGNLYGDNVHPRDFFIGLKETPDVEEEDTILFFFSPIKKMSSSDGRICRKVGGGKWQTGTTTPVKDLEEKKIGTKTALSYKESGSGSEGFVMHEFRVLDTFLHELKITEEVAVCKLIMKKSAKRKYLSSPRNFFPGQSSGSGSSVTSKDNPGRLEGQPTRTISDLLEGQSRTSHLLEVPHFDLNQLPEEELMEAVNVPNCHDKSGIEGNDADKPVVQSSTETEATSVKEDNADQHL